MSEPVIVYVSATCRTDGCGNAGIEIPNVPIPEGSPPSVLCGVCGEPVGELSATYSAQRTSE